VSPLHILATTLKVPAALQAGSSGKHGWCSTIALSIVLAEIGGSCSDGRKFKQHVAAERGLFKI